MRSSRRRGRGFPAGYILFADRQITPQLHVGRQDNYHPLRQLMFNILTLDRMIWFFLVSLLPLPNRLLKIPTATANG